MLHINLIYYQPLVWTKFDRSIWPTDWTLTVTITSGQSGPGSNSNEGVLHIRQSSNNEVSLSDGLVSYPGHMLRRVTPICRDAADIFYDRSYNATVKVTWNKNKEVVSIKLFEL